MIHLPFCSWRCSINPPVLSCRSFVSVFFAWQILAKWYALLQLMHVFPHAVHLDTLSHVLCELEPKPRQGSFLEMGLEPVLLQLEHVATNRSLNHHSSYLGHYSVADRQACLLYNRTDHTVMCCSLHSTENCQLIHINPKCSDERCQYCDRFLSVLLLGS